MKYKAEENDEIKQAKISHDLGNPPVQLNLRFGQTEAITKKSTNSTS